MSDTVSADDLKYQGHPHSDDQPRDGALLGGHQRRQTHAPALYELPDRRLVPRSICPVCGTPDTKWFEASGFRDRLHLHREPQGRRT